ncbi:subtilase family protein [Anoxybacillus sp. B7M1]|nr:subtilase family protein [Anoxybacillus sp. B2M1]ANB64843.1 subtilase family protein [Anoxybacillus sp. B7M1]
MENGRSLIDHMRTVNSVNRKLILGFFAVILFFVFNGSYAHGQALSEWLIYFRTQDDYLQFLQTYQSRVEDTGSSFVVKARFSSDEIKAVEQLPIVSRVEPNYQKTLAETTTFNDPFFFQQWGLRTVGAEVIAPSRDGQNLLDGREVIVQNQSFTYEEQPLSASSFSFLLNGVKLSRLSLEMDHVEGNWRLEVKDGQGNELAANEGNTAQLDVLLPQNRTYDTIHILIQTNGWSKQPIVKKAVAVNHVTVAVIDTGVSVHEDFCGNVLYSLGKDYVDGDGMAVDENGHGTHVAGIIAACPNNGKGIVGAAGSAPVDILPLKVLDAQGTGGDFEIAQAVNDAVAMGANVINFSLAGKGKTLVLEQAISQALLNGIPVVAAAGNWGTSLQDIYPASYPGVITVAAIDEKGGVLPYSDYGWEVDVSAPGANIISTFLNDTYKSLSGTSMATPFVTSEVAMLKAEHPELDVIQIRKMLSETAFDIGEKGYDIHSGYGTIQIAKALQASPKAALDWLTIKNGQQLNFSQSQLLGVSDGLVGKNVYIWLDDQLILKKKADRTWISVTLPDIRSGRNEKTLKVIAVDDAGTILATDERLIKTADSSSASFSDVPASFWAYQEIQRAYQQKLINGFTDGTFRPNQSLSRRHAVMMMNRLFHWPLHHIQPPFADVPIDLAGALSIYAAYDQRVVTGYSNGSFAPEKLVTRAQMAVMLARALKLSEHSFSGTPYPFKDLSDPGHFAYDAVQQLADKGIISKQDYFRPNEYLTRAQFAALLIRASDYLQK